MWIKSIVFVFLCAFVIFAEVVEVAEVVQTNPETSVTAVEKAPSPPTEVVLKEKPDVEIIKVDETNDGGNEITIAHFLSQILFQPLADLLQFLRKALEKITVTLDSILAFILELLARLINSILYIVIAIPLAVLRLIGNFSPGIVSHYSGGIEGSLNNCSQIANLDPINDTLVELGYCVTGPAYHIVSDLSEVVLDLQRVLGALDRGIRKIEKSVKISTSFGEFIELVVEVENEVLEVVSDLISGPVADLLIAVPGIVTCVVGDLGKNLLGETAEVITESIECVTTALFID